jgi:hypothetical protein
MNEKFELTLLVALPSTVRKVLRDHNGRAFLANKLREATFAIAENSEDSSLTFYKADPFRPYFLVFQNDSTLVYKMVIANQEFVNNPWKYFLEVLFRELNLLQDVATEYISSQNVLTAENTESSSSTLYIG